MSYINAYVQYLERWYWWTYLQGSSGDTGIENRLVNTGGEGGGCELRECHWNIYSTICKIESPWEFAGWPRELKPGVLCDSLEGWDRVGGGRVAQQGEDIYMPMTDACWCMAESTQYCKATLLQLDINKLNKKKYQARTGTEARARGDRARRGLPARQEERPEKRGARRS